MNPSKTQGKRLLQARGCLLWSVLAFIIVFLSRRRSGNGDETLDDKVLTESSPAPEDNKNMIQDMIDGSQQVPLSYIDLALDFNNADTVKEYCDSLDSVRYNVDKGTNKEALLIVKELLDKYVKEHSKTNIFPYGNDNKRMVDQDHQLCVSKRSFVVGTYACPQQLGTRIFEFLNAFAGAVILNRTLIWHYCDRDSCRFAKQLERCDEMIERKHWMASAEEVTRSLSRGGCPKAGGYKPRTLKDDRRRLAVANKNNIHLNRLRSSQTPKQRPKERPMSGSGYAEPIVSANRRSRIGQDAEGILACCGLDNLYTKRVIDFGTIDRQEMFGMALPGSHLGPRAADRAFRLFTAGANQAYGLLFRYAFNYSADLNRFNMRANTALDNIKRSRKQTGNFNSISRRRLHGRRASLTRPMTESTPPQHFFINHTAEYERHGPSSSALRPARGALHPTHREPSPRPTAQPSKSSGEFSGENEGSPTESGDVENGQDEEQGPFVLAVHVRHMRSSDSGERDVRGELDCIKKMLALHVRNVSTPQMTAKGQTPPRLCTVLLASDRSATLDRLKIDIETIGCDVLVANHKLFHTPPPVTPKSKGQGPMQGKGKAVTGLINGRASPKPPPDPRISSGVADHGPFKDSFAAMADIQLLSRAHAFIGSSDDRVMDSRKSRPLSMYSVLIASLISSGEAHIARRHQWEKKHGRSDDSMWERWLPACSDGILGSYLLPDIHSPVRTPRYSNVSLSFDVNLTHFFSDGINKDNRPLNARRMGPSLGSGHYSPGFCSSFAWGGKCAQLRDNEDSSLACKTTKD